jgi:hypothetical protein
MKKLKKEAFALLKLLHAKEKKYIKLNQKIRKLQGDFPTHIQSIDEEYYAEVVKLLDLIIGDEWASYLLFECDPEGSVELNGKKFRIRNVDDIIKFQEFEKLK